MITFTNVTGFPYLQLAPGLGRGFRGSQLHPEAHLSAGFVSMEQLLAFQHPHQSVVKLRTKYIQLPYTREKQTKRGKN